MERLGIVRCSNTPWASPLHMVTKANGGWRPCGDFRCLNNATTPDRYPVLHIQDLSAHLAGATIFSKVDLVRSYHQLPVHRQDVLKMAVITPFGLFKFLRMPFGLKGAVQTFQCLMDLVLRDMPFLFVYLDDILVASASAEDHLTHSGNTASSSTQPSASLAGRPSPSSGHHVSPQGAIPLPAKVDTVTMLPRPRTVKSLQEFLAAGLFQQEAPRQQKEIQHLRQGAPGSFPRHPSFPVPVGGPTVHSFC